MPRSLVSQILPMSMTSVSQVTAASTRTAFTHLVAECILAKRPWVICNRVSRTGQRSRFVRGRSSQYNTSIRKRDLDQCVHQHCLRHVPRRRRGPGCDWVRARNSVQRIVAIIANGDAYVIASAHDVIYQLREHVVPCVSGRIRRASAKGILAVNGRHAVVGMRVATIDLSTVEMQEIDASPSISDFDGLAIDKKNRFLTSLISNDGAIWALDADGGSEMIHSHSGYLVDPDRVKRDGKQYIIAATVYRQAGKFGGVALMLP